MIFLTMTTFLSYKLEYYTLLYPNYLSPQSHWVMIHTVFLLVSFVFIIQHLLSDKAITAPQTHESNTNSVQIPTLSGYLLCKQSVYIPAAS